MSKLFVMLGRLALIFGVMCPIWSQAQDLNTNTSRFTQYCGVRNDADRFMTVNILVQEHFSYMKKNCEKGAILEAVGYAAYLNNFEALKIYTNHFQDRESMERVFVTSIRNCSSKLPQELKGAGVDLKSATVEIPLLPNYTIYHGNLLEGLAYNDRPCIWGWDGTSQLEKVVSFFVSSGIDPTKALVMCFSGSKDQCTPNTALALYSNGAKPEKAMVPHLIEFAKKANRQDLLGKLSKE